MTFQEQINWFKTSISFQIVMILLCKLNPYLSATFNIPTLSSGELVVPTIQLLTGTVIGTTNIPFFNQYILSVIALINFVLVVIIVAQITSDYIPFT